jgi:hypothetical protein
MAHDVIHCAGVLDAQFPRHGVSLITASRSLSISKANQTMD